MTKPRRPTGTTGGPDADQPTAGGEPPRMPRWVKAFAAVAVLLVLLLALKAAFDGGGHGPGLHGGMGPTASLPTSPGDLTS